jgi:7-cyano-7-deazaguanine synthase in queuosine biosynthesis
MRALGPKYRVSFGCGDSLPEERFAGRHFHLDHRSLAKFFFAKPTPLLDDLLRVSTSAYVIDRLAKRRLQKDGRSWPRRLRMSVEVLEPDFWSSNKVALALTESLEFVSGDCWEITFEKAPPGQAADEESFFPFTDPYVANQPLVCLYSGGLDSAAGLVRRIRDCPGRPVIPVTVWHQPRQKSLIERQFRAIKERCHVCLAPVVVKAAMVWNSQLQKEERSQRCRPFLFAAVGGVVAAMQGASRVEVLESGVGAINLPLMAGMVGSKATRSCHPEFLRLMSRLVTLVAGREIVYRLPFMDRTKGEMVKMLANVGLENLARSTVSCVHFPLRERRHKQCGVCPACIFRRHAMLIGGVREPRGTYKFDLFGPSRLVNRIPDQRLKHLKAFLMQVVHLAALDSQDELPRRLRRHLLGSGVIGQGDSPLPQIELLRRYRQEWLTIAAEGKERGWSWVNLLTPTMFTNQGGLSHASA